MANPEHVKIVKRGKDAIAEWRAEHPDDIFDLEGADLNSVDLTAANLSDANLTEAFLRHANLTNAILPRADFSRAHLSGADLTKANLSHANLTKAYLFEANLVETNLRFANLTEADLGRADLTRAGLFGAKLTKANLERANLAEANVENVDYTPRWSALKCKGVRAETCHGHALFKRDMQDADWLETWRTASPRNQALYRLWLLTSDCGRSLWRVAAMGLSIAIIFAVMYWMMDAQGLGWWGDHFHVNDAKGRTPTLFTYLYYSIVTFTTLGFGDVYPLTSWGELVVTIEVILGYLNLGLLVSILAQKVARRS